MKIYNAITVTLAVAFGSLLLISCETTGPGAGGGPIPPNSGRLIVNRVANFGSDLSLVVSIDGKDAGSFTEGTGYNGYLPAGQHRISVRAEPTNPNRRPGRATLTVVAGQTYSYTAAWSGGKLVLVRNS